jgi:hypothetical protein
MECLGLHNKPKAEVHPGHKLTGPKEEEEEELGDTEVDSPSSRFYCAPPHYSQIGPYLLFQ